MAVSLSALRTGRALLSRIFFLLLLSKPQGLVLLEGLGELRKIIYVVGSRTRDFPAYLSFI
jgi:hypothetical protein